MAQEAKALEERYLADFVMTATPVQRLLMLFNHLKSDLVVADVAFETIDYKRINDSLVHAQQILMALRDVLDPDSDLGSGLRPIYTFCIERLIGANLKKDRSLIPAVSLIVDQIAAANERAATEMSLAGRHGGE